MREIKFRAWDGKAMVYEMSMDVDLGNGEIFKVNFHTWPDYEFMQYTGIKDKNGKEIYEGDIVQIAGHWDRTMPLTQEVIYDCATFLPFDDSDWGWGGRECEIIGNKYENLELLEKQ